MVKVGKTRGSKIYWPDLATLSVRRSFGHAEQQIFLLMAEVGRGGESVIIVSQVLLLGVVVTS